MSKVKTTEPGQSPVDSTHDGGAERTRHGLGGMTLDQQLQAVTPPRPGEDSVASRVRQRGKLRYGVRRGADGHRLVANERQRKEGSFEDDVVAELRAGRAEPLGRAGFEEDPDDRWEAELEPLKTYFPMVFTRLEASWSRQCEAYLEAWHNLSAVVATCDEDVPVVDRIVSGIVDAVFKSGLGRAIVAALGAGNWLGAAALGGLVNTLKAMGSGPGKAPTAQSVFVEPNLLRERGLSRLRDEQAVAAELVDAMTNQRSFFEGVTTPAEVLLSVAQVYDLLFAKALKDQALADTKLLELRMWKQYLVSGGAPKQPARLQSGRFEITPVIPNPILKHLATVFSIDWVAAYGMMGWPVVSPQPFAAMGGPLS